MYLHCQGYAHLLLNYIILEVSNEVWGLRENLGLVRHSWALFSDSAGDRGGRGHLFGCVQQRGGLSSACLLDHLVEEAVPVLEQRVWPVVLLDPAGSQNLQSRAQTRTHRQCRVSRSDTFCVQKSDISAVWLLSETCRQCKMNGETVVLCTQEPSI